MPQHKVITERVGFTVPAVVLAQADTMFEARNEYRSEMILRIVRAFTAGTWEPKPTTLLPSEGTPGKVQLRLRPQDITPYREKCTRQGLPISFPVQHGLWIYAHEPDPTKLPF
jgi:hypothetical protein